jgi:hypothetical protein
LREENEADAEEGYTLVNAGKSSTITYDFIKILRASSGEKGKLEPGG